MYKLIPPEDYKTLFVKHKRRVIDYTDPEFLLTNDLDKFSKEIFYTEATREITNTKCGCVQPPDELFTIGMTCPVCEQVIRRAEPIGNKHECWIVIDEKLPPVIAPGAYRTLDPWFGKCKIAAKGRRISSRESLLKLLITPRSEKFLPDEFSEIKTGLISFNENFDKIVSIMMESYKGSRKYKKKNLAIAKYLEMYRDRIFTRHIPMLDRRSHLLQEIGDKLRTDQSSNMVIQIILGIGSAYRAIQRDRGEFHAERNMASVQEQVFQYSTHLLESKQFKKSGHLRKYMAGARMHFSLRALVTPSPEMPPPDIIHLPWTGAVVFLRMDLLNKLLRKPGANLDSAYTQTVIAEYEYDEEIDNIFKDLIASCKYPGIPVFYDRNPSLQHGSISLVFVGKVKPDVTDKSISDNPIGGFAANRD